MKILLAIDVTSPRVTFQLHHTTLQRGCVKRRRLGILYRYHIHPLLTDDHIPKKGEARKKTHLG